MQSDGNRTEGGEKKQNRVFPLVSVIVPTYRHFENLYQTLGTVVTQSYPNIELIISDDASESFPAEDIRAWLADNAGNDIRVCIRQNRENLGTVANANLAAKEAKGELIKLLPPGDGFSSDDSLLRLVSAAEKTDARVLTSCSLVCKERFENVCYRYPLIKYDRLLTRGTAARLYSVLLYENILCAVGAIYKRAFFEEGGFDEKYRYLDDWPTWLFLLRRGERIGLLNEVTVYYMLGGISTECGTAYNSELLKDDMIRCIENEVLPYMDRIPRYKRKLMLYRYYRLRQPEQLRAHPVLLIVGCGLRIKEYLVEHLLKLLIWLKCRMHRP